MSNSNTNHSLRQLRVSFGLLISRRLIAVAALSVAAIACSLPFTLHAQVFPAKPVRIIVPVPAGSGPDVVARMIAEKMSAGLKQPVLVENRLGGSGVVAISALKAAEADGHTLVLLDNGQLAINPFLFERPRYDVENDFAPVGMVTETSFLMVTGKNSPYGSLRALIGAARSKPDAIAYATPFVGSPSHLGGARLAQLTGTTMLHTPFSGPQMLTSISNGDVAWGFLTFGTAGPLIASDRLKVLAVAAGQRLSYLPSTPTIEEAGGPKGFELKGWLALVALKASPALAVNRLNNELNAALSDPLIVQRLKAMGFEPMPGNPNQVTKLTQQDSRVFSELVKLTGAKSD
ncbi:MAG: tripartite tricarboxylate transporter substrate binding protein [Polaromonas sp.]|uniref:Bug family tripartite tricarboxylate transporter substrate binding protein n=1 Tax=Polaromonas sp. TaxID=1869339 RepID=UPI0025CF25A4|nr:tripartite tricarboxylate transporter substrate binding protein [Polaromonas sp.]MBI2727150.1 tripartite tricarboxylate transporter substrate binding protein [Polaromonas sp.]